MQWQSKQTIAHRRISFLGRYDHTPSRPRRCSMSYGWSNMEFHFLCRSLKTREKERRTPGKWSSKWKDLLRYRERFSKIGGVKCTSREEEVGRETKTHLKEKERKKRTDNSHSMIKSFVILQWEKNNKNEWMARQGMGTGEDTHPNKKSRGRVTTQKGEHTKRS